MWFYRLKRAVRTTIAIVSWLPLVVFAVAISPSIGENGENIQAWQAVVAIVLFAIPVFFDVLAIIARRRESNADKAQNASEESHPPVSPSPQIAASEVARKPTQRAERVVYGDVADEVVKLTRNGGEELQGNIALCSEGEDVDVDYDYDKGLYMCSANGFDIGYLPESVGGRLPDNARLIIAEIDDAGEKSAVRVAIYAPVEVGVHLRRGVMFPRHTKAVGVTFGDCQAYIAQSQQGDALTFKHAPLPQYPENTEIINDRTGVCVGRVNANLARELVEEFGEGFVLFGTISEITGGGEGKNLGCNVIIEGVK